MKNIYILQNSCLSFDMDISNFYSPMKYSLYLIVNRFSFKKLRERNQEKYFKKILVTDNFNFDYLKEFISLHQNNNDSLQIVTNAEEAIAICGQLRVYFKIDTLNYDRFKNKLFMKELLNKEGILSPKHVWFDKSNYIYNPSKYIRQISTFLTYPLLVKPIDSMGCNGIKKRAMIETCVWAE